MSAPRILVISGSTRPGSINTRLATHAADRLNATGAAAKLISLSDFPMPMVDASGYGKAPQTAHDLRALIDDHEGMFIVSPEYNAGYAPLLKNALDWMSVAKPSAPGTSFSGKVVGLGGASPGMLGALRGLTQLRTVLELGFGALVIPEMIGLGGGDAAWTETGTIKDERASAMFDATIQRLIKEARFNRTA
jgi:chromate reductase, NAD(P)H dehydrogenase (quinone)